MTRTARTVRAEECDNGNERARPKFHAAYSTARARAAVPELGAAIGLEAGARETFSDMRRRGVWPDSATDTAYQAMVDRALALGFPVEEA